MSVGGDEPTGGSPVRVGTVERSSAIKALDEHLSAGRLDVEEYADRSAKAANAVVVADLTALFTDLPYPHPDLSAVAPVPVEQQSRIEQAPRTATVPAPADEGALFGRLGTTLVAVAPIVAFVLFITTGSWLWFLLIPAAGAVIYGGGRLAR